MRFADPHACPDCRGVINGQPACPQCGLDLTTVEVRQLWQMLLQADELLGRASHRRVPVGAVPPPAPAPQPMGPPPAPPARDPYPTQDLPSYPTPPSAPARAPRRWSVGTVLLVLGPFSLIVAGLIFVTRSWEDVGLAARTLILLGITVLVGVLGVWVTRRPLRASAEAVWTIFLSLLTLDFFAARHEGLAALGSLDVPTSWVAWGVVVVGLGVGIALWARPLVTTDLVTPAIAAGLGITIAGLGAGAVVDDLDFAWRAIIAVVVAGLLALATRPAGLRPMTLIARIVFAGFFTAAYVAALVDLVDNPALDDLVGGGHGAPLVLMVIASVVVAALVKPVRIPAVALAVFAVCALVVTPVSEAASSDGAGVAIALLAAVLGVAGTARTDDWGKGVRAGAAPVVLGLLLIHVVLLAEAVRTGSLVLEDPWQLAADTRLDIASIDDHALWALPVVLLALVVVAWSLPRWPGLPVTRRHAVDLALGAGALGWVGVVVAGRPPVWAAAVALLLLAAALVAAHARGLSRSAAPAATVLVAAATVVAAASHGTSAATWAAGALVLVVLATTPCHPVLRQTCAGGAAALGLASTAAVVDLLDVDDAVTALVVLSVALALVAVAGLVLPQHPVRVPVEAAAALGGFVALLAPGSTGEVAARWTVAGVVLVALAFVVRGRRWYVWPGAVALLVAYVLLIVDSGFSFVEAYTLPLGVMLLAAGLALVGRRPESGTWLLLGPGLAVAMLPSLPQALADPTGTRSLLLGIGAVVVLGLGIRLGWQAPFVAGAVVLALLVLFNIGPYANAAPRVVLLAVVGVVLTGIGITWEDRVRDGRRLVGYVRAMR
jgi:hypothetical protein